MRITLPAACALAISMPTALAQRYVPGQPGAAWTQQDMLIIRSKVRELCVALIQVHLTALGLPWYTADLAHLGQTLDGR